MDMQGLGEGSTETGFKWWLRYVIVPLVGSATAATIVAAPLTQTEVVTEYVIVTATPPPTPIVLVVTATPANADSTATSTPSDVGEPTVEAGFNTPPAGMIEVGRSPLWVLVVAAAAIVVFLALSTYARR